MFSFSKTGYTNPVGGGTFTLTFDPPNPSHNGTLQQLCSVSGTITSSAGGGPISGATVNLDGGSIATTASDGTYSICTTTGSRILTLTKSGFGKDTETVLLNFVTNTFNATLKPAGVLPARLSQLKPLADNIVVQITGAKTVTVASGVFGGDAVYIEEPDRTCGIKVVLDSGLSVAAGNGIELTGTLMTDANGERYIACSTIDSNDGSTAPLKALGVANNGVTSLVGTLVKVWGATTAGSGFVIVNDGSLFADGSSGIQVFVGGTTKTIGSFLSVTGIVRKTTGGALILQPRGNADID